MKYIQKLLLNSFSKNVQISYNATTQISTRRYEPTEATRVSSVSRIAYLIPFSNAAAWSEWRPIKSNIEVGKRFSAEAGVVESVEIE